MKKNVFAVVYFFELREMFCALVTGLGDEIKGGRESGTRWAAKQRGAAFGSTLVPEEAFERPLIREWKKSRARQANGTESVFVARLCQRSTTYKCECSYIHIVRRNRGVGRRDLWNQDNNFCTKRQPLVLYKTDRSLISFCYRAESGRISLSFGLDILYSFEQKLKNNKVTKVRRMKQECFCGQQKHSATLEKVVLSQMIHSGCSCVGNQWPELIANKIHLTRVLSDMITVDFNTPAICRRLHSTGRYFQDNAERKYQLRRSWMIICQRR